MANRFRRSLSFPKTLHNRSTGLPSHPAVSQLRAGIAHLHSWVASEADSGRLCDGLSRLNTVHASLLALLQLPRTRASLRRGEFSALVDRLLEDFLRLVDVYGRFQTLVSSLKDECSAAEMAARRRDGPGVDSRLKNLDRLGIRIGRLVSDLRFAPAPHDHDEPELVETIDGVLRVTSLVSASLFGGISASFAIRKRSYMGLRLGRWAKNPRTEAGIRGIHEIELENVWGLRKKVEAAAGVSKKLHQVEGCIVEIQGCGERALRNLINTRVSLLNLLTL